MRMTRLISMPMILLEKEARWRASMESEVL